MHKSTSKSPGAQEEQRFPIFCAWCEDRKTIVGWSTVPNSHGICPKHEKKLRRDTERQARELKAARTA
jgi:hypothetical protein